MWSMDWSRAWSPDDLAVIPSYIFNAYTRNSSSVTLNHLNARNIMRWWNLQRALRVGPFEYAMTILVGELREWRLHQDVLLNPPYSRDSSNTSYIDEDPGSAKVLEGGGNGKGSTCRLRTSRWFAFTFEFIL